jgi:hypothetical protein
VTVEEFSEQAQLNRCGVLAEDIQESSKLQGLLQDGAGPPLRDLETEAPVRWLSAIKLLFSACLPLYRFSFGFSPRCRECLVPR